MSQARPWMAFYGDDYYGDTKTQCLTAEQHGYYQALIWAYWKHGGLPNDDESVRKILGKFVEISREKWRRVLPSLRGFFDDEWRHARIDKELRRVVQVSEKRQELGKAGATKRWQ